MSNPTVIDHNRITPKLLEESDNVSQFSCGVTEIDTFIHEEALSFQNERLGVSYLFFYQDNLIGFVTLSMADLKKERMNREDRLPIGRENYPALQIGQLAVCSDLQGKDVGTYICDFCLNMAIELSERVGCRFLVLNAKRRVIGFYRKYGFRLLAGQEQRREPIMFLNIFGRNV